LRKLERVYRALVQAGLKRTAIVRQQDLSKECRVSLGMVNKVVSGLEAAQAVEATRQGVRILSPGRILNLWATERRIHEDVWRSFRLDGLGEADLPGKTLLTAFSGWSLLSGRKPAEYYNLHFYVFDKEPFESWLSYREASIRKTNPNVFVLYAEDEHLQETSTRGIVSVPQLFVDLYAIDGPEAAPFLRDIVQTYPALALY